MLFCIYQVVNRIHIQAFITVMVQQYTALSDFVCK